MQKRTWLIGEWWFPWSSLMFPKVPQSSPPESLGFPSYPFPLNTIPLKNPTNDTKKKVVVQRFFESCHQTKPWERWSNLTTAHMLHVWVTKIHQLDDPSWSNYSDLTRPHPKWWLFSKGNPLFQGNLGWWNIIIWPDPRICVFFDFLMVTSSMAMHHHYFVLPHRVSWFT